MNLEQRGVWLVAAHEGGRSAGRRLRAAVRPTGIQLLSRGHQAEITMIDTGAAIELDGPPAAAPLIAALAERTGLLRNTFFVYTGAAMLLDWRSDPRATLIADAETCHLCDQPTRLLDPFDRQPCHKTCAETALIPAAIVGPYRAEVAA